MREPIGRHGVVVFAASAGLVLACGSCGRPTSTYRDAIELGQYLVVRHEGGVRAVDRASGKTVLDFDAPWLQGGFSFGTEDARGVFSLSGDPRCTQLASGNGIFARCSDRILYFNGTTAALIGGSPPAVEARAFFSWQMLEQSAYGHPPKLVEMRPAVERGIARVEASGVRLSSGGFTRDVAISLGDRELFMRTAPKRER